MSIIKEDQRRLDNIARMYYKTSGDMKEIWKKKWYELVKIIGRKLDESEVRDLQQILGNSLMVTKGLPYLIVCYMETDNGNLAEVGRIELKESRLIGKINSSAAWRVVLKQDKKFINLGYIQTMTESIMDKGLRVPIGRLRGTYVYRISQVS